MTNTTVSEELLSQVHPELVGTLLEVLPAGKELAAAGEGDLPKTGRGKEVGRYN